MSAYGIAVDPVGNGRNGGAASGRATAAANLARGEGVTMTRRMRPNILDPVAPKPWAAQAACGPATRHLFFGDSETATSMSRMVAARKVCEGCPVRLPCLQYALDNYEDDGVWGGMAGAARVALRKRTLR